MILTERGIIHVCVFLPQLSETMFSERIVYIGMLQCYQSHGNIFIQFSYGDNTFNNKKAGRNK